MCSTGYGESYGDDGAGEPGTALGVQHRGRAGLRVLLQRQLNRGDWNRQREPR